MQRMKSVSSESTWQRRLGKPGKTLPESGMRLLLRLLIGVIALSLVIAPTVTAGQTTDALNSSTASGNVVELSNAEADSLLDLIDDQDLRIRLLEVDLWEARAFARNDSTLAARRLELTEQAYERMLDAYKEDRDNWVERLVKQPLVWFGLGVWLAGQAQ